MIGPVAIESWVTIGGFPLWCLYRSWINSLLCKSENSIFLSSQMWYINLLLKAINSFKLWKIEKSTVHNILQSLLFTYHVELTQVDSLVFPLLEKGKWKSLNRAQLCLLVDYTVHGILQARILECIAVPFPRESSQRRDQTHVFHIAGRSLTAELLQWKKWRC